MLRPFGIFLLLATVSCGQAPESKELHVAAAANLSSMFRDLARECGKSTQVKLVPSFGATAELEQQIENGGPFDLFLAADTEHVDALRTKGLVQDGSETVYALGKLVIWAPRRPDIKTIHDLGRPNVKRIGVAKPELAPYGKASLDALTAARLWPALEPKVIYGQNIQAVKQFVDSSNVDAGFTALALVKENGGHYVEVDGKLHQPIKQEMCIVKATQHLAEAQKVESFLSGDEGRAIFTKAGYGLPDKRL